MPHSQDSLVTFNSCNAPYFCLLIILEMVPLCSRVFPWQLGKHSLSLWGLCLPTWTMRVYELARELCFCFSLANLSICIYLIFISQCAVTIGRRRRCLTSVFYNLIISLEKIINITIILLKIILSSHIYIFLNILSGTDVYVFI